MKRSHVALMLCILLLSTMFLGIGYASLATTLSVTGTEKLEKPPEIYISNVAVVAQSRVSSVDVQKVMPTNLRSSVTLSGQNATVTYEVTVQNNSEITYWYLGATSFEEYGQNDLIGATNGIFITTKDNSSTSSDVFDTADWIPPKTSRIFYATYSFGPLASGTVSTLVNFKFGLRMESVQDEFLNVINDRVSEYGYHYLAEAFDDLYAETGGTVLGNVGDDKEIFNNLFGANLSINVDGESVPVTIMIERKNVDGNASSGDSYSGNGAPTGCEYTIYITTDNLSQTGGTATVYAVSYTCGADGLFYQIGELYEGKSTVIDYDTSTTAQDGAFDVSKWTATAKTYNVTDKISYKVGYEQGTEYDKYTTLEQIMSAKDQEFYNKVNNNSGDLLKPVCQTLYTYQHNNGQYIESENFANKYKQGYDGLKTAFDKIKPYCYIGNGAQEVKIQNANSLSRAELIRMLEEIQNAYDYYNTVNATR